MTTPRPIHLHPTAAVADRVLLPGDPGRALALAQVLLGDDRRMFNHNRGLWGYSGTARDGAPLTVQATGMGGPSAAIVLEELADLGVTCAIRVGTCGALDGRLALGDLLAATEAVATDGTSRALGAGARVTFDAGVTAALAQRAAHSGPIVSTDLFYDPEHPARARAWTQDGALAVEMEAAALGAVARRRGLRFGCLLAVSDLLAEGRERLEPEQLDAAGLRLGQAAAEALASV